MGTPARADDRARSTAAIGRERERAIGRAVLAEVAAGHARVLVVLGEAGIGKTTFAEAVAEEARHDGWLVAWSRTATAAAGVPFHPWIRALQQLRLPAAEVSVEADRLLATAMERLSASDGGVGLSVELACFAAVEAALRAAGRDRPTLVVLEDADRCDAPSVRLIEFVGRELAGTRVAVLITAREATSIIEPHARSIVLPALTTVEVAALARHVTGLEPDAAMAACLSQRTGGNPFLVVELLRAGGDPRTVVPPTVEAFVRNRLSALEPFARRVVETVAIVDAPAPRELVDAVTGLAPDHTVRAFDAATRAELLRRDDREGYVVRHALLGDAVRVLLPAADRAALHARIGEALEGSAAADPNVAAEIARHYDAAVDLVGAARAAAWAAEAGRTAVARCAHADASRHFARAVELRRTLEPSPGRETIELMLALGDALARSADLAGGRTAFLRACEAARSAGASDLLARAALGAGWWAADLAAPDRDVEAALVEAAHALDDEANAGLRARVLARLVRARYRTSPLPERDAASRDALRMARACNDPATLVFVLSERHQALGSPDSLAERLAAAEEIVRTAEAAHDRTAALLGYTYRALDLLESGDATGLDQVLALRLQRDGGGDAHATVQTLRLAAMRATLRGELAAAESLAARAHALGVQLTLVEADAVHALQLMYMCRLQGRTPDLGVNLASAFTTWPDHPGWRVGAAFVNAVAGNLPAAREALARLASDGFAPVPRDADWLASMALLADVAGFVGERTAAATLYDLLRPYGDRHAVVGSGVAAIGAVAFYLARLAAVGQDWAAALDHLDRADAQYAGLGATPLAVLSDQLRGFILLERDRPGDRAAGTKVLAGTRTRAHELGMRRVEANVTARIGEVTPSNGTTLPGNPRTIRREGEYWTLTADGSTVRIRHCKGMAILAELLRHPGRDFYVRDLLEPGDDADAGSDLGPILDQRARNEYRRHIADLSAEQAEAETLHDSARASRAREELERMREELARTVGLGGRPRRARGAGERARLVVRKRIRVALGRIRDADGVLAHHLETTIRTGMLCVYRPAPDRAGAWVG